MAGAAALILARTFGNDLWSEAVSAKHGKQVAFSNLIFDILHAYKSFIVLACIV